MFERYTAAARRTLFFSRYEASVHGSLSIETEHLLLGLMREGKGALGRVLSRLPVDQMRDEIARRTTSRARVPTSVEIPFSGATTRALRFAAEEADRLRHPHIAAEHLLLGLLRDEHSMAGSVLVAHGLRLREVRNEIEGLLDEQTSDERHAGREVPPEATARAVAVDLMRPAEHRFNTMDGVKHIDMIKDVLEHLGTRVALNDDACEIIDRMREDLEALRALVTDSRRE